MHRLMSSLCLAVLFFSSSCSVAFASDELPTETRPESPRPSPLLVRVEWTRGAGGGRVALSGGALTVRQTALVDVEETSGTVTWRNQKPSASLLLAVHAARADDVLDLDVAATKASLTVTELLTREVHFLVEGDAELALTVVKEEEAGCAAFVSGALRTQEDELTLKGLVEDVEGQRLGLLRVKARGAHAVSDFEGGDAPVPGAGTLDQALHGFTVDVDGRRATGRFSRRARSFHGVLHCAADRP